LPAEQGLIQPDHAEVLLGALDGTDVKVEAESNSVHWIGDGFLRIVTHPSGAEIAPDASCVDGLDSRQWQLLRELQQPGERLPLLVVAAEMDGFRTMACTWVTAEGLRSIPSFKDLQTLVAGWDGREPPLGVWQTARVNLLAGARDFVTAASRRQRGLKAASWAAQVEAARLRLIDELGRTLICFDPVTDDLNGKFHRLASDGTATAGRLQTVYARLAGYPDWDEFQLTDLRDYRASLTPNQVKTRLTGRELDAALADPRWALREFKKAARS
jgi:hypothetical protein